MSKHTPGPWVAAARTNAHIEIEAPDQPGYLAKKVAVCSLTNHEANARLIAAAPDLLEALRAAVADWDEEVSRGRWLDAARAAIKAAEGEKA